MDTGSTSPGGVVHVSSGGTENINSVGTTNQVNLDKRNVHSVRRGVKLHSGRSKNGGSSTG